MHNRFSVIRGKLTKDNKFECQACAKQQAEDCTSMERNDQSLKTVETFCYLEDK